MITGNALIAGVIGDPIAHSLSPKLHNYWLQHYQIDGVYVPFHVRGDNLQHVIQSLPLYGIKGVNVTVPHKEAVMPYLDYVDETATRIGAVNTIFIKDNQLHGTNTDSYGFIENILCSLPEQTLLSDKTVMIIGAGGASRAAIDGLLQQDVKKIYLTNRTVEKAQQLQQEFGAKLEVIMYDHKEDPFPEIDLLVNSTALGMQGKPPLDLSLQRLKDTAIVHDIVYNPLETRLLRAAKERGLQTITGIGMLLYQAVPGFEHWFGTKPDVTNDVIDYMLS